MKFFADLGFVYFPRSAFLRSRQVVPHLPVRGTVNASLVTIHNHSVSGGKLFDFREARVGRRNVAVEQEALDGGGVERAANAGAFQ